MIRVLMVEDDVDTQRLVAHTLGAQYQMTFANTLSQARQFIEEGGFHLYIIDLSLPDGPGHRICAQLTADQHQGSAPIIVLTGSDSSDDKLMLYQLGADDYIHKPIDHRLFRARVENRLRKAQKEHDKQANLSAGDLKVDVHTMSIQYEHEGKPHHATLTAREHKMLVALVQNAGRILTRNQLIDSVWGQGTYVTDRVVDQHISSLRKKLGHKADYIQTIYGSGYIFNAAPAQPSRSA